VIVKLTPNVTDIRYIARAAVQGGADALSLINTINSITSIDLDDFVPRPKVASLSSHGGYCGPAVKPIALHMLSQVASDPATQVPVSGIGGVTTWRDAAEFIALGAATVQVCTAAMHHGFRIVEDLCDGLSAWMDRRGFRTLDEVRGRAVPQVADWGKLDLNFKIVARIDAAKCIGCQLCYVACQDTAHQCIYVDAPAVVTAGAVGDGGRAKGAADSAGHAPAFVPEPFRVRGAAVESPVTGHGVLGPETLAARIPWVKEDDCVGCNLCMLVCPVHDCIRMVRLDDGATPETWNERQQRLPGS
jgi:dihydropyrimidine dehydrogenase (NAD+) subunit PreA